MKIFRLFTLHSWLIRALVAGIMIPATTFANPPERVGGSNFAWSMDGRLLSRRLRNHIGLSS